jgi:transposase/GNAT superfamily N-acetyltransferase
MKKPFPITIERFCQLQADGVSMSKMASQYGISVAWVSTWAKRNGLGSAIKPTANKQVTKDAVEQACAEGLSTRQMADKFGISKALVSAKLKQYGIKTQHEALYMADVTPYKAPKPPQNQYVATAATDAVYCAAMSESSKALWNTPEYRARMGAAQATPEYKAKVGEAAKRMWADQAFKAYMVDVVLKPRARDQAFKVKMQDIRGRRQYRDTISRNSKQLWMDPEFRAKMVQIWMDPAYREKMSESSKKVWERDGYADQMAVVRSQMPREYTKPQMKVVDILTTLGIAHHTEHAIGPYCFDIYIPQHNILIEVQGTYWHGIKNVERNDRAKSTYIEQYRPELKLHYVWEHDCLQPDKVMEQIKYWLGITEIELVQYELTDVDVTVSQESKLIDNFLYTWHYQHHGRHGLDVVATSKGETIAVARFASPSRQEIATSIEYKFSETLELTRLCVHPRYQKKNLLSWFLSKAEKLVRQARPDVKCLVSFADTSYGHTGAVYKASNWGLHATVKPNYFYVDSTGWVMHKKTLWNHSKKMGMTETEYAAQYGYRKQWGREKLKFIRRLVTTK